MPRPRTILLTALLLTPAATAQTDEPAPETPIPERSPWSFSVRAGAEYTFQADVDDASTSILRAGTGARISFQATDKLSLSLSSDYEYSRYFFDDASDLIPGLGDDPFDNLHRYSISGNVTYAFNPDMTLFVGGGGAASWEEGAKTSEAWTAGGVAGLVFRVSDSFTLGPGLAVATQLEDNTTVIPLLFIRWQPTDHFLLETETGERVRTGVGGGLRLNYIFDDSLRAYLRGGFAQRSYRLNDDADHASIAGGVLRDRRITLGIGVDWRPIPGLVVDAELGVVAWQEYELLNSRGNERADPDSDPAPYLGLLVSYTF